MAFHPREKRRLQRRGARVETESRCRRRLGRRAMGAQELRMEPT